MTSPDSDGDRLSPAQERVLRKVRRFAAFSGLIMLLGFIAVFGAIAYKLMGARKSAADISGTIQLPKGASVRSALVAGDLIAVTVERGGVVETRLFDLATRAPRGVLTFASEP
ncbi:DUF6476 family protein [Ancylobacter amanitiformis]|uniref:Uncharacterized membrane protein (DUF485 family) n=1 Tax=Ancylobacter amanitiformis TaxID=217069 RepID=A0ABU0LSM5_9HYPH|nr:DUF6476 family protein [Ancylobacter amanitiformis]MDQ0511717.1 uncharacterized membrane protein (DUF485 family) [Ancylobacter amanitiformis]